MDPRKPPRYRLDGLAASFDSATQVFVAPTTVFELPRRDAFKRGRYLALVTEAVRILRETTTLTRPALLTLRLREHDTALAEEARSHPERLRVFRKNVETGQGVDQEIDTADIELVPLEEDDTGIRFPITRFGSYLVALDRER